MITAERYLSEKLPENYSFCDIARVTRDFAEIMKGFADEHVREALEKASRAAKINLKNNSGESQCLAFGGSHGISGHVDKHSIANAYPKSRYIL